MPSVGGSGVPAPPNGLYNVLMGNSATMPNNIPTASSSANLNGAATTASGEEISTIFVVGFPDDMQEREFQNMFIFSPGFEAATLKIPSKDQDEDSTISNGNGGRKQIIGFAKFRTRFEALEAKDILSGRRVDAEKGSVLKAEMAKKNLHTKRGLSSGGSDQQQQQQQQQQPLPPLPAQHPMSTTSHPLTSQQQQQQHPAIPKRFSLSPGQSAYEAFHSVPAALPSDIHPPNVDIPSYSDLYPDLLSPGGTPIVSTFNDSVFASRAAAVAGVNRDGFDARSASMGDIFGHRAMSSSHSAPRLPGSFGRYPSKAVLDAENDRSLPHAPNNSSSSGGAGSGSGSGAFHHSNLFPPSAPPAPPSSAHHHHQQHQQQARTFSSPFSSPPTNMLSSVHEEMYPLQLPSQLLGAAAAETALSPTDHDDKQAGLAAAPTGLSSRLAGLSISTATTTTTTTTTTTNGGLPSPGISSPTGFLSFAAAGAFGSGNAAATTTTGRATIRVSNLPANAYEDELVALFSKFVGYQRLWLRSGSNGPVCLVDFEDMAYATRAVQELYGTKLSNSVSGGLCLSLGNAHTVMGVRSAHLDSLAGRLEHHQQQNQQTAASLDQPPVS